MNLEFRSKNTSGFVNIFTVFIAFILIFTGYMIHVGGVFSGEGEFGVASCSDNVDNDFDGPSDCSDSDCTNVSVCGGSEVGACSDGLDNDEDGLTDSADSDCTPPTCPNASCDVGEVCAADCTSEGHCSDGVDNDEDGQTDSSDSDCAPPTCPNSICSESEACSADCSSETYCIDGVDNDEDGLTDSADSDCIPSPGLPDMSSASDTGSSDTDNITNDTSPDFTVSCQSGLNVDLKVNGNFFTSTICIGGVASFLGVGLQSNATSIITANQGGPSDSNPLSVEVDIDPPSPPGELLVLTTASDTGYSNSDNITMDDTPTFTIGACSIDNIVKVYEFSNGLVGSGVCASGGAGNTATITTSNLPEGTMYFTAKQVDVAGNESPTATAQTTVLIDTTSPVGVPSIPDLDNPSDTGLSIVDDITNDTTPTFASICNQSLGNVEILVDSTSLGVSNCVASLASLTSNEISEGIKSVTSRYVDIAGNVGTQSGALSVTIDTTPPGITSSPDMTIGTDIGLYNDDNITNDTTPNFDIGCDAGNTVTLSVDASPQVGNSQTCSDTSVTITANGLSEGNHQIAAKQTDVAGNDSNYSDNLSITIDTTAPVVSSVTPTTSSIIDNITSLSDISFTLDSNVTSGIVTITRTSGVADSNSPHTCFFTGTALTSGSHTLNLADTTNGCTSNVSNLVSGSIYTFTFQTSDLAGNANFAVTRTGVTFDNSSPSVSITAPSDNATVSGSSVTLTTTSSDNVGISSVQFSVDDIDVGSSSATSPYSITWDSTGVSDGTHTIKSVAIDTVGNRATSTITVTVSNSAPPPGNNNGGGGNQDNNSNSAGSTIAPATGGGGGGFYYNNLNNNQLNTINTNSQNNSNNANLGISPSLANHVFIKNISIGAVNSEVIWLQKFLNSIGIAVSKSGAGSPGKETGYFGPATKKALIKFQKNVGITPSLGNFGTITRTYINNILKFYK